MDVGFGVVGDVVVDDMADAWHVDAAGGNIGGNQNVERAGPEPADGSLTRRLVHVTVERVAGESPRFDPLHEFDGGGLRAHEDQHPVEVHGFQQSGEGVELVWSVHQAGLLLGIGHGRGFRDDADLGGLPQIRLGDRANSRRDGG